MNVPRLLRRLFRKPFDGLRHFGVVEERVLYRCGQPTPEQLSGLIRQYGLRTVVSFRGTRGEDDPDRWEQAEVSTCREHDVEFVAIPCNHKNPPTLEQAQKFFKIVSDPQRRPVLIHCRLGQQRTLLFAALYRVHFAGLSPEQAEAEMDRLGFNVRHRRHQVLLKAFRDLSVADALARNSHKSG